ncbi:hypothetical protein M0Q50_09620 [bacterium]|jgi:hypothetical protein|nr:hypothetical protein [bacterium]
MISKEQIHKEWLDYLKEENKDNRDHLIFIENLSDERDSDILYSLMSDCKSLYNFAKAKKLDTLR